MNEYLEDIVNRIAEQITDLKNDGRSAKEKRYANFLHGIEHLINQLWLKESFDTMLVFENGKTQVFNSHVQPPSV